MSKANIGWLFYKEMYKKGNNDEHIKNTINKLLKVKATDKSLNAKNRFKLETIYPGLIIGSGYNHGLSSDYDAKIGFYFDYTTGLPVIPGSSVKGLLRSYFGLPLKNQSDKYKEEKQKFINELLGKNIDIDILANEIFEGIDKNGNPMSIYERDIFYEARVVSVKKDLLLDDYITPHEDNPLKNPTPIRFIKVVPEVTFEFSFDLKDSKSINDISAQDKEMLFLKLLQEFGIGAKTNVGYGQFKTYTDEEIAKLKEAKEKEKINAQIASADSVLDKLKLELQKKPKPKTLHKSIKNDIDKLNDSEKEELLSLICNYIKPDNSLNKEWIQNTSKRKAEPIVGKWHIETLKLFV